MAKVQKKYFACGICTEKIFFLRVAFVQKKSVFSEGCHGPMDLEKALVKTCKKKKKKKKKKKFCATTCISKYRIRTKLSTIKKRVKLPEKF